MQLSVLIRNLNEADTLRQTLMSLQRQQTGFEYEVVVIDNESDDDSKDIATSMGARVFSLARKEFTFGRALNYGMEKCNGDYILILSAHVLLLNEFFLKNIAVFFNDPNIAALRFVQVNAVDQVTKSMEHGAQQLRFSNDKDFAINNWQNMVVNHCSAIRKECWEQVPFDEHAFASEDKLWSLAVLKKGYYILYNVPCFYAYVKPFSSSTKIRRTIIEEAAKQKITGTPTPLYGPSYGISLYKRIRLSLRQIINDIKVHTGIYKGLKAFKKVNSQDSLRK